MRVARIFNTYGPRMHINDGRVVSNFILQALTGQDITVSARIADSVDLWLLIDLLQLFLTPRFIYLFIYLHEHTVNSHGFAVYWFIYLCVLRGN